MDSTLTDFLKQVPIGLLLAPLVFGVLYVILMVYIFQRAAERRRRAREGGGAVVTPAPKRKNGAGGFLSGQLPNKPLTVAAWSVPAGLRDLPEPDLESLSAVPLLTEPETVESALIAPSSDWLAMMAPALQEETMPIVSQPNLPNANRAFGPNEPTDAVEVMRVWRDLSDGALIIQMGDQRYRSVGEIANAELVRRFSAVVRELWNMVNNGGNPGLTGRAQNALAAPDVTGAVPPPEGSAGGLKARIGLMTQQAEADDASKQRQPSLFKQVTRTALGQSPTPAKAEPRRDGIGDVVEQFLQFKLSNTPQFQMRSIHVRPAIDGGVRIEVDGHFYDSVGDVIDADVREFLLTTLREWDARH